jgi:hypothetical protein
MTAFVKLWRYSCPTDHPNYFTHFEGLHPIGHLSTPIIPSQYEPLFLERSPKIQPFSFKNTVSTLFHSYILFAILNFIEERRGMYYGMDKGCI